MNVKKVWLVAERDIFNFLEYRFLLLIRWIWFIFQIFLFGLVSSRFVVIENYFNYYASGMVTLMFYITALYIGYDLIEEAEHGVIDYLLSLPFSRREFVIGRSIGGGLRASFFALPSVLFVSWLIGGLNPFYFALAIFSLLLFSFSLSGFSISLAAAIKSHDKFDILMGVIDAFMVRLSTAMYPVEAMPRFYALISSLNPLSFASDVLRWGFNFKKYLLASPATDLTVILIFFLTFNAFGSYFYERRLEGGGWT